MVSVPHSGTRTLVKSLGNTSSPRGDWLHFDYDDGLLDTVASELHMHIPIRHPMDVAASWARRDKLVLDLIAAYDSMFDRLSDPHTIYRIEDLPVLEGGDDDTHTEHDGVDWFKLCIAVRVVAPHHQFFADLYPDIKGIY